MKSALDVVEVGYSKRVKTALLQAMRNSGIRGPSLFWRMRADGRQAPELSDRAALAIDFRIQGARRQVKLLHRRFRSATRMNFWDWAHPLARGFRRASESRVDRLFAFSAEPVLVAGPAHVPEVGLPFETRGIELSHRHNECSFETSLRVHRLTPARDILCSSMTARMSGGRTYRSDARS
ncbi:hypothetical protein [Streptomyces sp. NPDC002185]|uniref:hypothetical protein n=1 Tax=Streptomyces sp. NPDC002185 TaxID=3364636 RepID=UPI0036B5995F